MTEDPDYDEIDVLIDTDPIKLGHRCRAAEALLGEVAQCGAEDIDERIWYMEVQVDKDLWKRLQPFRPDA